MYRIIKCEYRNESPRMARRNFVITALVLVCVAFVLSVVGYAIPYWESLSNGLTSVHTGLWKVCYFNGGENTCEDVSLLYGSEIPSWLYVVRAFVLLGILGAIAAGALTFMYLRQDSNLWALSSTIVTSGSWVMLVIGVATYNTNRTGLLNLAASFYLVSFSDLLCLLSGILLIASWRLSPPGYQSM
ncbi:uncharacterized protein LOC127865237 isoform X1 [Dreissena polymorpha]|nr:uncharacterized protein LOC127865237 isoform X1 [Dreissena polymorpha]